MKREEIIIEIKEILLDDTLGVDDSIEFDSMSVLLLIAFLDDNFSIPVQEPEIKKFKSISSILTFIGNENIEQ
jgi:acyl carrier protein